VGGTTPEHHIRNASWQSQLDIVTTCRFSNCTQRSAYPHNINVYIYTACVYTPQLFVTR
jgi:hypothetical protein